MEKLHHWDWDVLSGAGGIYLQQKISKICRSTIQPEDKEHINKNTFQTLRKYENWFRLAFVKIKKWKRFNLIMVVLEDILPL